MKANPGTDRSGALAAEAVVDGELADDVNVRLADAVDVVLGDLATVVVVLSSFSYAPASSQAVNRPILQACRLPVIL